MDIDADLIIDRETGQLRAPILNQLDLVANATKADIFLLMPKQADIESASFNGNLDTALDSRLRCAIYGDMETMEHAKTRILIMIDQIVSPRRPRTPPLAYELTAYQLQRHVDSMQLDLSLHTVICGRARKNIKLIESQTGTAIYFPPPFPGIFGYQPQGAMRRQNDLIFITGENSENILRAKAKLHDLVSSTKCFIKPVHVTDTKLDSIILERLDKVRKIMENNGSYILLPPLGARTGLVRVQGTDVLHVERTIRDLMTLVSQCVARIMNHTYRDRPANFTARLGALPIPTLPRDRPLRLTSALCSVMFASILEPRSLSRSSTSTSLGPTMQSRRP